MGLSSSKNNADLFLTTNGVIAQKTPLLHNSQIEILEMMTNQKWEMGALPSILDGFWSLFDIAMT